MIKKQQIADVDKLLAALSYVWVLAFIPFVLGHGKPFVYKHAKQGVALFVFEILLMLIAWVPIIGWMLGLAGWMFVAVCALIGIGHALSGKDWVIPIIGEY